MNTVFNRTTWHTFIVRIELIIFDTIFTNIRCFTTLAVINFTLRYAILGIVVYNIMWQASITNIWFNTGRTQNIRTVWFTFFLHWIHKITLLASFTDIRLNATFTFIFITLDYTFSHFQIITLIAFLANLRWLTYITIISLTVDYTLLFSID